MRLAPERLLRATAVASPAAALTAEMALWAPQPLWWQSPAVTVTLLIACALACARGELAPELQDSELSLRARRAGPSFGLLLGGLVIAFPTLGTWWVLWSLLLANLLLLAFASDSFLRPLSLVASSAGLFGLCVLEPRASWGLPVLGLAWVAVPVLDRVASLRLEVDRLTLGALRAWLPLPAVVGGVAALAFAVGLLLLPPSVRVYRSYDLLKPLPGAGAPDAAQLPTAAHVDLPLAEVLLLLAATSALAGLVVFLRGRTPGEPSALEAPPTLAAGAAQPLEPAPRTRTAFPAGPRGAAIRAYLAHLERAARAGWPRASGETPRRFAARLRTRLARDPQAQAEELAERFNHARWGAAPVSPPEAEALAQAAQRVEQGLREGPAG